MAALPDLDDFVASASPIYASVLLPVIRAFVGSLPGSLRAAALSNPAPVDVQRPGAVCDHIGRDGADDAQRQDGQDGEAEPDEEGGVEGDLDEETWERLEEALDGADSVFLVTRWPEFDRVPLRTEMVFTLPARQAPEPTNPGFDEETLLTFGVFLAYPIVRAVWISLFDWRHETLDDEQTQGHADVFESALGAILDGEPVGSGMDWLGQLYADLATRLQSYRDDLDRGEALAADDYARLWKAKNDARSLVLFPYFLSTVVAVLVWRWLFNDLYGILNHVLMRIGIVDDGARRAPDFIALASRAPQQP